MADTLLFALPEAPDSAHRDTRWWHVVDGELVSAGSGDEWLNFIGSRRTLVGIAPAAQARVSFSARPSTATNRQAEAAARLAAVNSSLGGDQTLHSASAVSDDGSIVTAVAARDAMAAWIEWARTLGAEPDRIVPAVALLPLSDRWTAAAFGEEHVVGRRGTVLPDEPDLTAAVTGGDRIETLDEEQIRSALADAAEGPLVDLRTGLFARRRRLLVERDRVRELAIFAALIPLVLLAWALVLIVKLERSTDRLNAETLAVATAALGKAVTLDSAEAELAERSGGSAFGGVLPPLTATYQALQGEQSASLTSLSYAPDGTLSVTLAAPDAAAINRVLVALQRNGYRITAVPRQSPDGRSMADATVRSGP
jgi:general secretion pathway protein L